MHYISQLLDYRKNAFAQRILPIINDFTNCVY